SDVGLLREGNEDSAYAGPHLLAVADGMGGHAAGEVASAATIEAMAALDVDEPSGDLLGALASAVATANMRLQEMILADPATEGMGTTLTALLWADGQAALCHIGDSRAYLLRAGQFYQITHDHTLVQSLVDEGRITEDDVATHPQRSLLLRALDGRTLADPDLSTHETTAGDRYLLCSDGLSGVVTEQTLHQALSSVRDPDKAALQLVELALKGGGPDNITCIVADVVELQTTAVAPSQVPVMAGAASTGAPQVKSAARPNSPAARAVRLRKTAPQQAVPGQPAGDDWAGGDRGGVTARFQRVDAAADQPAAVQRGSHRAGQRPDDDDDYSGRAQRRWPIVTTLLVVLVLALATGGFASWQWVQGKYYIGADGDDVAIYHGINSSIFGVSLSSLQRNTGLPVARVSVPDQGAVRATVSYNSLAAAEKGFNQVQSQVTSCETQWNALVDWKSKDEAYLARLAAYNLARAHAKPGQHVGAAPTAPGPQPATPSATDCAAASAFGIPAAELPTGAPTTPTPTATKPATATSSAAKASSKPTPSPTGSKKA
ncbi:MAG: phosphoprotein phosphatase, partial [Actinomycetia bacterium]|nr:phosphoprotein phosphatase [Actinomycetes bacterium]